MNAGKIDLCMSLLSLFMMGAYLYEDGIVLGILWGTSSFIWFINIRLSILNKELDDTLRKSQNDLMRALNKGEEDDRD